MPRETDRDRLLEQLLRRPAADSPAVLTDVCVDGEVLAAWMAGTLRSAEATVVEHHVADCARCQTMLAAFARATPSVPAADPWWRRGHVRWLVPLATAATVAAIWVAVPNQPARRALPAVLERPTEGTTAPDQQSQKEKEAANVAAQPPPAASARVPEALSRSDRQRATPQPQLQAKATPESVVEERSTVPQERLAREADRPLAAGKVAPRSRDERAAAAAGVPPAAPPTPAESKVFADTVTVTGESPVVEVEIASPNAANRWRLTGTTVQRSTDGGGQWEPATIASSDELTAGHSPASSIAWLVGRRGAVYITTDGSSFLRLPFLEPVDLVAVSAVDDREATVTAADGRTFRTTNRGETWIRGKPM